MRWTSRPAWFAAIEVVRGKQTPRAAGSRSRTDDRNHAARFAPTGNWPADSILVFVLGRGAFAHFAHHLRPWGTVDTFAERQSAMAVTRPLRAACFVLALLASLRSLFRSTKILLEEGLDGMVSASLRNESKAVSNDVASGTTLQSAINPDRQAAIHCYNDLFDMAKKTIPHQRERGLPVLTSVRYTKKSTLQLLFVTKDLNKQKYQYFHGASWYCDDRSNKARLWPGDPHRHSLIMECPAKTNKTVHTDSVSYDLMKYLECERACLSLFPDPRNNTTPHIVACTQVASAEDLKLVPQWIEYHKLIGVDQIWVYLNDSWNDTLSLTPDVAKYFERKDVQQYASLLPFEFFGHGFFYQQAQQNDCLTLARHQNVTWAVLTDVDEYLQVRVPNMTLQEFVKQYESKHIGGLSVSNWFFGSPQGKANTSIPFLIWEYQHRTAQATNPRERMKVLARPENVEHFSVHMITKGKSTVRLSPHTEMRLAHFQRPDQNQKIVTNVDTSLMDSFGEPLEK